MEKHVGGIESQRLYLFDNMKAILVVLVVLGHLLNSVVDQSQVLKGIYTFIYIFHMPVFVFITGYFSKNIEKSRNQAVEKYLIPYVIFCILLQVEKRFLNIGIGEEMAFRILSPTWGMWYLLAVFWWKLFLKDMVRIRYILPMSVILGLMSGFSREFRTYLGIGRTVSLLFFFLLGYYCTRETVEKIRRCPKIIGVCLVAVTAIFAYFMIFKMGASYGTLFMKKPYRPDHEIIDFLIRGAVYILGAGMTFAFINLTSTKRTKLTYIGTNSVCVYILHLFLVQFIERFYDFKASPWVNFVFCIVISIGAAVVFGQPIFAKAFQKLNDGVCTLVFQKEDKGHKNI